MINHFKIESTLIQFPSFALPQYSNPSLQLMPSKYCLSSVSPICSISCSPQLIQNTICQLSEYFMRCYSLSNRGIDDPVTANSNSIFLTLLKLRPEHVSSLCPDSSSTTNLHPGIIFSKAAAHFLGSTIILEETVSLNFIISFTKQNYSFFLLFLCRRSTDCVNIRQCWFWQFYSFTVEQTRGSDNSLTGKEPKKRRPSTNCIWNETTGSFMQSQYLLRSLSIGLSPADGPKLKVPSLSVENRSFMATCQTFCKLNHASRGNIFFKQLQRLWDNLLFMSIFGSARSTPVNYIIPKILSLCLRQSTRSTIYLTPDIYARLRKKVGWLSMVTSIKQEQRFIYTVIMCSVRVVVQAYVNGRERYISPACTYENTAAIMTKRCLSLMKNISQYIIEQQMLAAQNNAETPKCGNERTHLKIQSKYIKSVIGVCSYTDKNEQRFASMVRKPPSIHVQTKMNPVKNNISFHLPEQLFLTRILDLKKTLEQDNYTNIRNISQSNHNFNEVFCYLKGIIRKLQINYDKVIERNQELERELRKADPHNLILLKLNHQDKGLGEIGAKFNSFAPLKSKSADSFTLKISHAQQTEPKLRPQTSKKVNRENLRKQTRIIQIFIRNLSKNLVQDRQKQFPLPKQMLMNLYFRWNASKQRSPLVNQSLIKSQLTNELKKTFPNIDHNDRFYRGIIFRENVVDCTSKHQNQSSKTSQEGNSSRIEEEDIYWQLEHVDDENLQNHNFGVDLI